MTSSNIKHTQALADAIVHRNAHEAREAIERGAHPSAKVNGTTPLHLAAMTGTGEVLQTLLDTGADPNVRDSVGRSPLHYAAMGVPDMDTDLVQMLLSAKADPNIQDDRGCTPLDLAAGAANTEAASVLARSGATCKTDRRAWVDQVSKATPPSLASPPSAPGRSSSRGRS